MVKLPSFLRGVATAGVGLSRAVLTPTVQDNIPASLRRLASWVLSADPSPVHELEARLWGGFSQSALRDLNVLVAQTGAALDERAQAHYVLACWSGAHQRYQKALEHLDQVEQLQPACGRSMQHRLLKAQFLCLAGRGLVARRVLEEGHRSGHFEASRELLLASTWSSASLGSNELADANRALLHLNAIFSRFGLCEITSIDPEQPLSIDNLTGRNSKSVSAPDCCVTVIVPSFNAAGTIDTALRGLAEQSWESIQVIVVDDCSSDGTCARVEAFCEKDSRFALVRKLENSGSYESRNLALELVDTPFVTVHDADDWSHPQKIQRQVEALIASNAPYNYSMIARATADLMFLYEGKPKHRLVGPNHSAGMFRTADVRAAGGWDKVRISGDTELFWRLERLRGKTKEHSRQRRILNECPLSFARVSPHSLTQVGPTHALTMFHGVRREYREAAAYWHSQLNDGISGAAPFFPAPHLIRSFRTTNKRHDLLVIADFASSSWCTQSALRRALGAAESGFSTAILDYRHYPLYSAEPLPAAVRQLASKASIRIVAPGESVHTDVAVVEEAGLLHHKLDRFPDVDAARYLILVNVFPPDNTAERSMDALPQALCENANSYFGPSVCWVAGSNVTAEQIGEHLPLEAPLSVIWPVMNAVSLLEARAPNSSAPVLAYCRTETFACKEARSQSAPRPKHGRRFRLKTADAGSAFSTWLSSFPPVSKEQDASPELLRFFSRVDCFAHFPHSRSKDPFGFEAALAMSYGVPVIVPSDLRVNFGSAAMYYDEPDTITDIAEKLCRSPDLWQEQRARGLEFVNSHLRFEKFSQLLSLGTPKTDVVKEEH
jgi:hypothetical protein